MLKQLALVSGLALASTVAFAGQAPAMHTNPADAFAGAYAGGALGVSNQYYQTKFTNDGVQEGENHVGRAGVAIQALGGYNFALGSHWVLGPVVTAEYDTNDDSHHHTTGGSIESHGHTKINWQFGAAAKLGYVPFEHNMFYVVLGPQWGHFHHDYTRNDVKLDDENHYIFGVKGGLGAEQFLTDHLSISEEIDYTYYQQHNHHLTSNRKIEFDPSVVTGVIGLQYHFS